jgi:sulfatase maturation enzyme AslB (radical SAM superfamily)
MSNVKNTLCPVPWISQSLRANGDVRVCCQAQHGPTGGILKDDSGNALNAKTANLSESRNSSLSKEIRKTMMEGNWHPECVRCQTETESGMNSRIIYENEYWINEGNFSWDEVLKHTSADGTIDTTMIDCTFYDVRFGNLCNLKCRMCGPTDSSQWYDDQAELWGPRYKDSHGFVKLVKNEKDKFVPEEDVYNWHESESYWEQMDGQIPQITKLYIVGGEPLLIDRHYEFLQKCVDQGQAKKMTIEYNTNLTNIPPRAWNIWKHFKQVNVGASIDGVGDINHYMRYPANFDQIHKNLLKLSTAEGNFKVWIAATVNVFNVLHFPEFMEWILLNKISRVNDDERRPIITPHPLHGPKFYNIRMLPKFAKDHIKEKYESYKPRLLSIIDNSDWPEKRKKSSRKDAVQLLDQYIDYMYSKDFSDTLPMFWTATRKLDKIRGHSIEDYIPELYELLKDTEI